MMFEIELPILWHSEADSALKELGLDTREEYEIKILTFYNINAIRICDENQEQTSIYANGENYVADLPIHEVKRIINNAISKRA